MRSLERENGDGRNQDSPTIVVVDDDDAVRRFVAQVAEAEGWRVFQCGNGAALLALMAEIEAADLVLLDVVMPETDGIQVLRQLGQLCVGQRVALVSGADPLFGESAEVLARAAPLDLVASLRKPLEVETLRELLEDSIA